MRELRRYFRAMNDETTLDLLDARDIEGLHDRAEYFALDGRVKYADTIVKAAHLLRRYGHAST